MKSGDLYIRNVCREERNAFTVICMEEKVTPTEIADYVTIVFVGETTPETWPVSYLLDHFTYQSSGNEVTK